MQEIKESILHSNPLIQFFSTTKLLDNPNLRQRRQWPRDLHQPLSKTTDDINFLLFPPLSFYIFSLFLMIVFIYFFYFFYYISSPKNHQVRTPLSSQSNCLSHGIKGILTLLNHKTRSRPIMDSQAPDPSGRSSPWEDPLPSSDLGNADPRCTTGNAG